MCCSNNNINVIESEKNIKENKETENNINLNSDSENSSNSDYNNNNSNEEISIIKSNKKFK